MAVSMQVQIRFIKELFIDRTKIARAVKFCRRHNKALGNPALNIEPSGDLGVAWVSPCKRARAYILFSKDKVCCMRRIGSNFDKIEEHVDYKFSELVYSFT